MRTIAFMTAVVGFGIAALVPAAMAQEEQWLQYHSAREAERIVRDMDTQRLELSANRPEGVELPEFKCQNPAFVHWSTPMVKAGGLWIVLDRTRKDGLYDLLYIDSNADGHLKDETAVEPYRSEEHSTYFGPVKVVFEGEDGPVSYHLNLRFYRQRNLLYVTPGGWYEGPVKLGQEQLRCVLIDRNANGTFDDKSSDFNRSDRIRLGKKDERDGGFVGNYIQVEGVLYRLEVARDGAYIKLTKAEDVTFGSIRLPETIADFAAGGENGLLSVPLEKGAGQLPIGKYRIHHWGIERKDEKGRQWRLEGRWFGDEGDFEVTQAGRTSLDVGEPVRGRLRVSLTDENYGFDREVRGKLGEYVELSCNNRTAQMKMQVKNKQGTFDRAYALEDG